MLIGSPPKENSVYLSDTLRSEKPAYYVESASGKKRLTASVDEIGAELHFVARNRAVG